MPGLKNRFSMPRFTKKRLALACLAALALFIALTTHFDFSGRYEGVFLLKGKHGAIFELTDDIYLGDGKRYIIGIDFDTPWTMATRLYHRHEPGKQHLVFKWNPKDGSGYVRNFISGEKRINTSLGRYIDDNNVHVHGLFVGGGLPADITSSDEMRLNDTGMAYNDGKNWYHLWCTVNEAIISGDTLKQYYPSSWKFLGSRILNQSSQSLALESTHEVVVHGVPLRVTRYAYFRAGDTYFLLSIFVKNIGKEDANIIYLYGDDPWLGNFGSSKGNVGWVKDKLIKHVGWVDTDKYSFAGYYDYGNDAVSPDHNFTNIANFIEWFGSNKPRVFFSNSEEEYPENTNTAEPLYSNERFINLVWGPKILKPGKSEHYVLAIGMAGNDPKTGFPVKPEVRLNQDVQ